MCGRRRVDFLKQTGREILHATYLFICEGAEEADQGHIILPHQAAGRHCNDSDTDSWDA